MRDVQPRELQFYRTPNGHEPFAEWFNAIRDTRTRTRIQRRLVRLAILGTVMLLGTECLNCGFTLAQAIASILVTPITYASLCSVVEINQHSRGILNVQKTIGLNTRRRNHEKIENPTRVSNGAICC